MITCVDIGEEFSQCNKCGLCLAACPVSKALFLEKYSPRGKIQLVRFYEQRKLVLSEHFKDIFSKCLLCGACTSACPSGLKLKEVFVGFREEIANQCGLHHRVEMVVRSLIENHNISDEDNEERMQRYLEIGAPVNIMLRRGTLKEGEEATGEELREFCRDKIAHFKIPRYFKFVDSFPMTVTGKIQKYIMRERSIKELGKEKDAATQTA